LRRGYFFPRVNVLGISDLEALSETTKEALSGLGISESTSGPLKTTVKRKSERKSGPGSEVAVGNERDER